MCESRVCCRVWSKHARGVGGVGAPVAAGDRPHGGSLTGSGTSQGFAITFGGNFTLGGGGPGVSAAGTWNSSSGQTGTWNGGKTN